MIPDYCEALTGYRCWDVHANGLLLAQAQIHPWPPYKEMTAGCSNAQPCHLSREGVYQKAPVLGCTCGIYAHKEMGAAESRALGGSFNYQTWSWAPSTRDIVWGSVKLWGRVIEHDTGYRAEFAYPSELFCPNARLASVVSELYGVPCVVRKLKRPVDPPDYLGDLYKTYMVMTRPSRGIVSIISDGPDETGESHPPTPQPAPLHHRGLHASHWQKQQVPYVQARPGFRTPPKGRT